jgi:hypothetical protein
LREFSSPHTLECRTIYFTSTKSFCKSRLSGAEKEIDHNMRQS